MKIKILIGVVLLLVSIILILCSDLNQYRPGSKDVSFENTGIIFSITAYDGKNVSELFVKNLGHAWLSIDNRSGHSIFLKDYEIKPDETITFSTWAVAGHNGVFFNLEANLILEEDRYVGRQSLSVNIGEEQLKDLEKSIDQYNQWTFINNCSYWSVHVWNEIVEEKYQVKTQTITYTPARLLKSLQEYKVLEADKDFSKAGQIFFYQNNRKEVLQLCTE